MTDIAQLGFRVDSSGLDQGNRALDQTVEKSGAASNAAAKLENEYRRVAASAQSMGGMLANNDSRYAAIAARAMEYAEAMRTANMSERALADQARNTAHAFNDRAAIEARMGSEQERMAERVRRLEAIEQRVAENQRRAAHAAAVREVGLKKLLGQIDPTVAALDRLADQEERLAQARNLGLLSPEVHKQYQDRLEVTRSATLNMGKATDIATKSIGGLNLEAVSTQQSIASLARALVTGQWGQAQASITSLTARTGLMGGAFSAAGLMIGGAVAAIGSLSVMALRGYRDTRQMEGAIIGLGGSTGMTVGQLAELRNEIGRATGQFGQAREAIQMLVSDGKVSASMLESIARASVDIARTTGQNISGISNELQRLSGDGGDALVSLNDKYKFLTAETWEHIEAIRQQRGDFAANTQAVIELERVMDSRARQMVESAARAEGAWDRVVSKFREALQVARDIGRTDDEYLLQNLVASRELEMRGGARGERMPSQRRLEELDREIQATRVRIALENEAAFAESARMEAQADRVRENHRLTREAERETQAATAEIERQRASVLGLDTAVNKLYSSFAKLPDNHEWRFDGTFERLMQEAERADAQRSQRGAERSASTVQRIGDEERAAQRLEQQYLSLLASQERQIALYGQAGRAAAVMYDTTSGALASLSEQQKSSLREGAEWLDFLDDMAAIDKVLEEGARDHADRVKGKYGELSEYGKQAARNMQSHFANYLFDPFQDGLDGMLSGFSETIRRMLAEATASRIFEMWGDAMAGYTGAGSGFLNAFGAAIQGGRREYGGPVASRGMYRVGERNKPELLTTPRGQYLIPGEGGRVDPISSSASHAGRGMGTPQININVTGGGEVESATARPNASGGFDLDMVLKQVDQYIGSSVAGGTGSTYAGIRGRFGMKDAM